MAITEYPSPCCETIGLILSCMSDIRLEKPWTRDEITNELREAIDIVLDLDPPEDLRAQVFNVAVQLTTQRVMRQQVGGVHLPPPGPLS